MANLFRSIAKHPDFVNRLADEYVKEESSANKFTDVFKSLFPPKIWSFGENMESWLNIITKTFVQPKEKNTDLKDKVRRLFSKIGISLNHEMMDEKKNQEANVEVQHVAFFFVYLFSIYPKIRCISDRPDFHNIFRFMGEFKIEDTRVVILGHDPTPEKESSGFAYHKTVCKSTENLIMSANYDLNLADHFSGDGPKLAIEQEQIASISENCSLQGWIDQGVLLLNSSLTIGNPENKPKSRDNDIMGYYHMVEWEPFVKCLVNYLDTLDKNIVFILTGQKAAQFGEMIDKNKHLVINVSHPSAMCYRNSLKNTAMRWDCSIPFLNANFFLHKSEQKLIDWTSMEEIKEDIESRKGKYITVFEEMINNAFAFDKGKRGFVGKPRVQEKEHSDVFVGFCNSSYDKAWTTCSEFQNYLKALSQNVDPDWKDNTEEPILLTIARGKNIASMNKISLLKELQEKGINCNIISKNGETLLDVGVLRRDPEIVKFAIENGADPKMTRQDHVSPLQLAKRLQSLLPASMQSEIEQIIQLLNNALTTGKIEDQPPLFGLHESRMKSPGSLLSEYCQKNISS